MTLREQLIVCFYEFLGTSMLVLGYNFTSAGLAVCFNLFVAILMSAKISGAMFNPAVTIAVSIVNGNISRQTIFVVLVICSQILGAYFGIIFAHIVLG
jgi:glycerol uptake facilitator-like aquaporin